VGAAQKAALQWLYPPDFGLKGDLKLSFDYVQGTIVFRFDNPNTQASATAQVR
jgi:hypothetical protein